MELEDGKISVFSRNNAGEINRSLESDVIDNPYYGMEQETVRQNKAGRNETEDSSNIEVVTTTHNLYYEM